MQPPFHGDGIHFVGRNPVGEHRIEIERGAYRFCGVCAVTGHHINARNPGGAKRLNGAGSFLAQLVGQQQCSDYAAIDGNKDAQRGPPGCSPQRAHGPIVRLMGTKDQLMRAHSDTAACDQTLKTRTHDLVHLIWHL